MRKWQEKLEIDKKIKDLEYQKSSGIKGWLGFGKSEEE